MDLLKVEEVAEYLKVKPQTLYVWISRRKINTLKIQGVVRIPRDELDRLLDEGFRPRKFAHG